MRPSAPPAPPGFMPPYPGQGFPPPQPAGCPPPGWMPPPPGPYHSAQLYPGQPLPGQGYPGQPCPYQPCPAQPYPGMNTLPPHLYDFTQFHDSDQIWDGTPADVEKEMRLMDRRKDDNYPQGRENCKQFLIECQSKGLTFKVKAKKTSPHWTWFFELNTSVPALPGNVPSTGLFGNLSRNLSAFTQTYECDQTWAGTPSDVDKELRLMDKRKDDNYPQGRDKCKQFLMECKSKGLSFKVKAKKTSPYYTWYFEVNTSVTPAPTASSTPGYYPSLSPNLYDFTQYHDSDQIWQGTPSDADKEMRLMDKRMDDYYPQGRDNCKQFLMECKSKGINFTVKAKKTSPHWTWFFELKNCASPASGGYSAPGYNSVLSSNLYDFTQYHNADQTWECYPSDISKELGLIDERNNDTYPQGRDNCRQFLRECLAKGLRFRVKARKTSPYWTWYYELSN